jgi:hypothetical protein
VCVELDGTAAHPEDEQWRDKRRDNANTVSGLVTLRFGFPELGDHRCESASQVATLLRSHGWTGSPRSCGRPSCALTDGIPTEGRGGGEVGGWLGAARAGTGGLRGL